MRNYIFILLWCFIFCACSKNETSIQLQIKGDITDAHPRIVTSDSTYLLTLDSTGACKIILPAMQEPEIANLYYSDIYGGTPLYILPGTTLSIGMERGSVKTFDGESADMCRQLNDFRLLRQFSLSGNDVLEEKQYLAKLERLVEQCNVHLDTMKQDRKFIELLKKRMFFHIYSDIPDYVTFYSFRTGDTAYIPSEHFREVMVRVISDEDGIVNTGMYSMLPSFIDILCPTVSRTDYKTKLAYLQGRFKHARVLSYVSDYYITGYLKNEGIQYLPEVRQEYDRLVQDSAMKSKFDAYCARALKTAPGQPAPDFSFPDMDGNMVSLEDLRGKYVYIDIWATYCSPCRAEIPYLQKLEEKLKDKNIYFVSISVDTNKKTWENMVKKDQLGGIQLHCGKNPKFMDDYDIPGIPRFILIDPEGRFCGARVGHPSTPGGGEYLAELVK